MAHLAIAGGEPIRRTPFPRWPFWNKEEVEAVQAVVESGRWGAQQGGEVRHFEAEFAAYQEAVHGIAVTNGTVALKLALTAAGVGLGDEVIMPGYTFVATATAALEIGAVPVFADIDPHTYNLDPASAEACITSRTRALLPVHLGGRPADMPWRSGTIWWSLKMQRRPGVPPGKDVWLAPWDTWQVLVFSRRRTLRPVKAG